jgi:hypothetical protein
MAADASEEDAEAGEPSAKEAEAGAETRIN